MEENDLPINHKSHRLSRKSENFIKNNFPENWILNKVEIDYGIDFSCELANDKYVTGSNFFIQLKSTESNKNKDIVIVKNIKRSTINLWLNKLEPVMLITFVQESNEAYWIWIKDDLFDLTLNNKYFQAKIPTYNKISILEWSNIESYVNRIFGNRFHLYGIPEKTDNKSNRAYDIFFSGKYYKALPLFTELTKTEKNNSTFWHFKSLCEYHLFHYEEAIISINKALNIESKVNYLQNKASVLVQIGIRDRNKGYLEYVRKLNIVKKEIIGISCGRLKL